MPPAFGILEIAGLPTALVAADILGKSANVQLVGLENTHQARISVVIQGSTGAVQAALRAAIAQLASHPGTRVLGHHIVSRPPDNLGIMFPDRPTNADADETTWLDD